MLATVDTSQNKRYTQTKNKKYGKRLHSVSANRNEKKAGVATFMLEKIDFKTDSIERDKKKKRHFIMLKGSIQKENITLVNTYAPNLGAPKYIKTIFVNIKG